jgi:hypothetical protein
MKVLFIKNPANLSTPVKQAPYLFEAELDNDKYYLYPVIKKFFLINILN